MNAKKNFQEFLTAHYQDAVETQESAMEILYDYYAESMEADDPKIRVMLKTLREQLHTADDDTIMGTVLHLCALHQECGFRGGLSMGMALAKELDSTK